tara:strand:- start:5806 stop:6375 length:570 start_codon:yes stop_codon:yes gene_type:complete
MINKINVSGLSNDNNLKITKKLNDLLFTNILFVNEEVIKETISEYNLVETYSVKKIYPKKIKIDIEPTKFVARISGNNQFLVGSNGKLIKNETTNKKLPFLFGQFNSIKFLEFQKIIEKSKFNLLDFKSIFFYASNRWDILTIDNVLIKLPEKNLSDGLRIAHKIIKDDRFKNNRTLDLRISNRIISKK